MNGVLLWKVRFEVVFQAVVINELEECERKRV
jgi:hypothetical protein